MKVSIITSTMFVSLRYKGPATLHNDIGNYETRPSPTPFLKNLTTQAIELVDRIDKHT